MIMANENSKPLGIKNYGTIPHLQGSRRTPGDKHCHEGQSRIVTERKRDQYDEIIVQEKVDGSNVGVALLNEEIIALTRAGYRAETSPYPMHHRWRTWVLENDHRFRRVLTDGERICGEWLIQAHGTRYQLPHEPFVVFDIMRGHERVLYNDVRLRTDAGGFVVAHLLHRGDPLSVDAALAILGEYGFHGAIDKAEGCVWRVERKGKVDFLVKYVRPEKQDGVYFPSMTGKTEVWNTYL